MPDPIRIYLPAWADFEELVVSASDTLTICTPYYSDEGLGRLFDHLPLGLRRLRVWTRLSPSDWVAGVADPEALLALLTVAREAEIEVELGIQQRLHAKIYIADDQVALIGSANLSGGGFGTNLEMAVRLEGDSAREALRVANAAIGATARLVTVDELSAWVEGAREVVMKTRAQAPDTAEALRGIQQAMDRMLGFGRAPVQGAAALPEPDKDSLTHFLEWLARNAGLPGADVILTRAANRDGQNLTGHVKQTFAGLARFLAETPRWVAPLSGELGRQQPGTIYQPEEPVLKDWADHLDAHALDGNGFYSYATLRGRLQPSLGGTRAGGGGGSSTFKRMLPLVARYVEEGAP